MAAGILVSCENGTNVTNDENLITLAEDEISYLKSAESTDEEVCAANFGAFKYGFGYNNFFKIPRFYLGRHFPDCAEVTVSGDTFPKEITITYGDDCLSRRGLVKTGTIVITLSDTITNPGAEYTLNFVDVTIGNKTVEKSATIVNEGQNEDGNWVFSMDVTTTINHGDTLIVTRDYSLLQEWLSGFGTPQIDDDIFLMSGDGTITVNDEMVFQRIITDPLLIDRSCRFILSGVIEITRNDEVMTIDFGDGECDNIAVVTKDGVSEEIELISGKFHKGFDRCNHHMHKNKGWW